MVWLFCCCKLARRYEQNDDRHCAKVASGACRGSVPKLHAFMRQYQTPSGRPRVRFAHAGQQVPVLVAVGAAKRGKDELRRTTSDDLEPRYT